MSEQTSAFTSTTTTRERSGDIVLSALLIALGALLLLGNLGLIAPLSLRSVLSLWPVIPVLIGIQVLLGRTRPSLVLALQLGVLAIGLALVMARAYLAPFDFRNDDFQRGASPAIVGAPVVVVTARDIQFSHRELHLPSGAVNLTLRNDGVLEHDLTIPALDVRIAAESGESVTTGLRDLPKGRYSGYCGVSGHADAGMRLTVVVDYGSSSSSSSDSNSSE